MQRSVRVSGEEGQTYYAKWEADGATQRIHDLLRERVHGPG
ncbi:hypothetical protein ACGFNF_30120 [Micromonospora sp. NPDC048868]